MLLAIEELGRRVEQDLEGLVRDLQEETARFGDAERMAWAQSVPLLARALSAKALGGMHVAIRSREQWSTKLEYRLPASNAWVDAVVLGRDSEGRAVAVVIELKHWDTAGDQPGPSPALIDRSGHGLVLHPSEQASGYVEYCRRFHDGVQNEAARITGVVLFTLSQALDAYSASPHSELVAGIPVFGPHQLTGLSEYLADRLAQPDETWADVFHRGVYRQDRVFVRAVAEAILDPANSDFVLLDAQRLGFERTLHAVRTAVGSGEKKLVLVQGPPGSGKSVLAAKLWAELARSPDRRGDVVLVTTSAAQKSNWKSIFQRVSGSSAGRGLVKTANNFNPGLSPSWVKAQRELGREVTIESWKENLELAELDGKRPSLSPEITIVDEAHALIDPTAPGANGIAPAGWTHHAGPQAWHILKQSDVSVLLLDSEQSYRDNETTTIEAILRWAAELDIESPTQVALADTQFRASGSKEYVDWVSAVIEDGTVADRHVPSSWLKTPGRPGMDVRVMESPFDLDDALRSRLSEGHSARILASYGRKWRTKGVASPHEARHEDIDFAIAVETGGRTRTWARPWNYVPNGDDYTAFVQAPPTTRMAKDPLCEVGCPYVVRGFDWDYVGLLWLSDLVRRGDRWEPRIEHCYESAWKKTLAAAKREARRNEIDGEGHRRLRSLLGRGYRILMTRAIRGLYIWCEDPETADYLRGCLGR